MSEESFGIRVPGGDPGALDGAASDLSGASGALERSTTSLRDSATATPSWEGFANLQFFNSCTVQADTIALGVDVLDTASKIVAEVVEKLRAAKKAAKLAVDDAQEADTRRGRAEDAMQDAEREALAARLRATFARTTAASSSPLLPNPAASAEETHALKQAEAADQQAAAAQRSRDRAQGDLESAQRAGNKAEREYEDAANDAARMLASLIQLTPQFIGSTGAAAAATGGPGAPAALIPLATRSGASRSDDNDDRPFYKKALGAAGGAVKWTGDQAVGFGKGVGDGVGGIIGGAGTLYRLTSFNRRIDPESYEREQEKLNQGLRFAWENPGEFGKAVINWDDLSHGRYGEWLGNLGPDAAIAVATGGSVTAANRTLKGAESVKHVDPPDAPKSLAEPRLDRDVQLSGGRSGGDVKFLTGPPDSVVKGAPGQGFGPKRPPTQQELDWIRQLHGQ